MKYTSILEKLQYLFGFIKSSAVYIIFLSILSLLFVLFLTKKVKKNKFLVMTIILYLSLFIIVIFNNYQSLNTTFDSIITNLFTNIYFPSTYAYLFILAVVDIVTIISLFNIKGEKIYKVVNGICFGIIQFIFVIIMEIIAKNNIDIFSKSSLFTNTQLVAMLELSVNIFILWLVVLGGIFIVNSITAKVLANATDKALEKEPVMMSEPVLDVSINNNNLVNDYLYDNKPITNTIPVSENQVVEDNFSLNDLVQKSTISENNTVMEFHKPYEDSVKEQPQINLVVDNTPNNASVFDMILNNTLPVIKEESIKEPEKDITNYTLNDYKTFNRMLKEIRMYNIGSIVNIDKTLELRLLDKFSKDEYNLFKKMLKSYSN